MEEVKVTEPITTLSNVQQRFVHLYITGQYKLPKLAELLGVHYNTARGWLQNPKIREYIAKFQEEEHELIEMQIKNMRMQALSKMGELIESPIDGVALSACKDILDRSGHKPTQKVEKKVEVTTYEQQLKDLINSTVVDVDYVDGD